RAGPDVADDEVGALALLLADRVAAERDVAAVVAEREVRHAVEDRRLAGPEVEKPEPGADRLPGLLETFAFGAGDADRVGEPPPVAGERRAGAVGDDDRRIRVELPDPEFVLLVHTGDRVGEPPPVGREGPESEGFPLPVIG